MTTATSDAPSVASEPTTTTPSLESLDSTQLDHWRMTGELPSSDAAQTPPAESSPAQPAEQADRTESSYSPASEPGKPLKSNAKTRIPELDAEIQTRLDRRLQLNEELAEIERKIQARRSQASDAPQAESSPAPGRELAQELQSPDLTRPILNEAAFFEQFPSATYGDYSRYTTKYEILSDRQLQQVTETKQQREHAFGKQVADVLVTTPDFWANVHPRVLALNPVDKLPPGTQPTIHNVIAQELVTSSVAVKLIQHLSANLDVLDRLERLTHTAAVAREIGKLEARLEASSAPPPASAGDPVSLAPPPPTTLGKKPAQPADELAEAIKSGDFARYKELTDQKELRTG